MVRVVASRDERGTALRDFSFPFEDVDVLELAAPGLVLAVVEVLVRAALRVVVLVRLAVVARA